MRTNAPEQIEMSILRVCLNAGGEWRDAATLALQKFLMQLPPGKQFMTEDLREQVEPIIGLPHDGRAWGHIIQSAARAGWIRRVGYAPARSSNLSPKPLWEACQPLPFALENADVDPVELLRIVGESP